MQDEGARSFAWLCAFDVGEARICCVDRGLRLLKIMFMDIDVSSW
jgi:hypothetical protein